MLVIGGVFVLPIVLVKVTALFLGGPAPQNAQAFPLPVAQPLVIVTPGKTTAMSQPQQAAAHHVESLLRVSFGQSPFYYGTTNTDEPSTQATPAQAEDVQLAVQAIIVRPTGNIALINGNVYRVGDTLPPNGEFYAFGFNRYCESTT